MRRLRGNLGYVEISAQTQFAGTHTTPEQVSMLSRELWLEGLQNWLADMRAASSLALNVAGCSQACASNRFIKSCGVQCGAKEAGLKTCPGFCKSRGWDPAMALLVTLNICSGQLLMAIRSAVCTHGCQQILESNGF